MRRVLLVRCSRPFSFRLYLLKPVDCDYLRFMLRALSRARGTPGLCAGGASRAEQLLRQEGALKQCLVESWGTKT